MTRKAYFMDFEFETENATFFPRSETEILVEKACELLKSKKNDSSPSILDICTGCGNIAISLTNYIPSSKIVALDISDSAINVAKRNALKYGFTNKIKFIKHDVLHENLGSDYIEAFNMVVTNPPYVSLKDLTEIPVEVKNDPYIALYGGGDGLDFYRRIAVVASECLKNGGILLAEIGYDQADSVSSILKERRDLSNIKIYKDYSGINRMVSAIKWKD